MEGPGAQEHNPSLRLMAMVPLETVLGYFDEIVGVSASLVVGKCNGNIPVGISWEIHDGLVGKYD